MNNYYALIMAGGGGTRLWPMSRQSHPKQMIPLLNSDSLFRTSVMRLAPLFPPERVFVVTGRQYLEAMQQDVPEIPAENFIAEPYGRDSAPAAGLGVALIQQQDPDAVVAILTADHHIARDDTFRRVLGAAYNIALQGHIVTLGISPTFPSTSFGYIRQGELIGQDDGFNYYIARGFTEKPDLIHATRFVGSGIYTWNSGMFIWHSRTAMAEFERQQPEMHSLLRDIQQAAEGSDFAQKLDSIWERMPRKSIDYAIMEGAQNMSVIPVDIGWSDVGSWSSLFDVLELDQLGNCLRGEGADKHIILDTSHTLVYSGRLVVTIGIKDLVIVDTDDALLICHKDHTQQVKDVVEYLRSNGNEDYL